jgi:dihydrofolate reductase
VVGRFSGAGDVTVKISDARGEREMRKLIYAINVTLDGCCDHMKVGGSEELLELTRLEDVDVFVYGRKTYQLMVPYWPDVEKDPTSIPAEVDFARQFNSKDKVVFSRTLETADEKTKIVRSNLRDEIMKLKQAPGKDILLGGVDVASQIIQLGLVDEFRIVIAPIIAGEGRRLMQGVSLAERLQLKLVDSKAFRSGFVALRYVPQ